MNILIYIIAGIIVVNLLCLLTKNLRYKLNELWYNTILKGYVQYIKKENGLIKYVRLFIIILALPFFLIIYLIVTPFITIEDILKRKRQKEKHEKEYGFMRKVANKVILEGFAYGITPVKTSVFDNNKIYIEINLVIYPQKGGAKHYNIIFWNDLAKEVGKTVFRHYKIRVEGEFKNIKSRNKQGEEVQEEMIQADKIDVLKVAKPLRFSSMGGAGIITCNDCGYKEDIVSFLHGLVRGNGDDLDCNGTATGYQCQSCGKFYELNEIEDKVKPLICSCGGELSSDKALFCPQCKSKNMRYDCTMIT